MSIFAAPCLSIDDFRRIYCEGKQSESCKDAGCMHYKDGCKHPMRPKKEGEQ